MLACAAFWLQNPNVHGVRGKINTFRFDKETLERAGMGDAAGSNTPPFLVRPAAGISRVCPPPKKQQVLEKVLHSVCRSPRSSSTLCS
jgi:hypothetical protein